MRAGEARLQRGVVELIENIVAVELAELLSEYENIKRLSGHRAAARSCLSLSSSRSLVKAQGLFDESEEVLGPDIGRLLTWRWSRRVRPIANTSRWGTILSKNRRGRERMRKGVAWRGII
jgi:hypothetical protein